ncbi:hypothetical protein [Brucella intermedia]|uniref:hypothetical protein n=1 Tax=Brucella intermedia TaxID=94625 RepID=UPI00124DA8C1|nr:hypothetical protein [Brucella intermedia]KAB2721485.1 hypothetical protein F9L02_23165 [Brucella intermedia]
MKVIDPLPFWAEPSAISEWGKQCIPPIAPAWLDFINFKLHPDDLSILARVILPAFITVGETTLLQLKAEGHSAHALVRFSREAESCEQFEKDFNLVRIYELFSHAEVEDEASFNLAGLLLKRAWEITLAAMLPDIKHEVICSNTDKDYGPTITFCRIRNF